VLLGAAFQCGNIEARIAAMSGITADTLKLTRAFRCKYVKLPYSAAMALLSVRCRALSGGWLRQFLNASRWLRGFYCAMAVLLIASIMPTL
jgi:hypothetical protein